jgi:superfamily II DNA/RNA helicase
VSTTTADASSAPRTTSFADFGVEPAICESLAEVGITSPFPIQEMTLPLALTGADIIGQARTGTGKTLGFGLPLIQRIDVAAGLQALVIVPTRELCLQVAEDLAQAGKGKGVQVVALYGGKAMQPQIDALEAGAHLVVGTPGRLLDLARRGHLDLSACAGLVLDEADEMLDLGFLPDVEALIEQTAGQRQTLLFSATMPSAIVALARRYMSKPTFMRAEVEEITIAPKTRQFFFSCHRMDKPAVLARILQTPKRGLCVVFCRTKRMADILAEELRERDVPAQAIHSDLRQEARERVMEKFRAGKVTVLCATEVAARGLDIDDVTHVVNYDCPDDEKMYLHRIGRTGRAGADGVAITFAVWNELPRLEMIRRELDIEEEVHEVFSTSPLLDELFDLPVREERKKVPSVPQARSGTDSRSRRRGERADGRAAGGASESTGTAEASEGGRRPRRSGRRDDGAERATSTPAERPAAARAEGEADADRDAAVEAGGTRRRTRTRRSAGVDAGVDGGAGGVAAEAPSAGAEAAGEAGEAPARTRTRTRSERGRRTGGRTESDAAGEGEQDADAGAAREGRRRQDGGPGRSGGRGGRGDSSRGDSGGDSGGDSSGGDSSRGASSRREQGTGERATGRGKGERGKGGDRGTGDGRRSGSGRDGREARGGRGREGGRPSRPAIDHQVARGEGQPRLNRPLEVQHLP